MPPENHWTVDKRVPLAIIVTLVLQTLGAVWWAASLNERVSQLEFDRAGRADQTGRIIRLETKVDQIGTVIERVETKIDRTLLTPR